MSYDIWGNPLPRGHCEVHPHVHEEYPCSVCMAEKNQREQASQQSEAEYYMQLQIEILTQERLELLKALESLLDITLDSQGVSGYHLNGDIAEWDEFECVGEAYELIRRIEGGIAQSEAD